MVNVLPPAFSLIVQANVPMVMKAGLVMAIAMVQIWHGA